MSKNNYDINIQNHKKNEELNELINETPHTILALFCRDRSHWMDTQRSDFE